MEFNNAVFALKIVPFITAKGREQTMVSPYSWDSLSCKSCGTILHLLSLSFWYDYSTSYISWGDKGILRDHTVLHTTLPFSLN